MEKDYTKYLNHPIFEIIGNSSNILGLECYVVGGFVRDSIMGRKTNDIDIVVIGNGINLAQHIADKLKTQIHIFKTYGTAMLEYEDVEVEFVGARKESYNLILVNQLSKMEHLKMTNCVVILLLMLWQLDWTKKIMEFLSIHLME